MSKAVRWALIAAGVGGLLLALAYYVQWSQVNELWPWFGVGANNGATSSSYSSYPGFNGNAATAGGASDALPRLSYYFLSSICAAIAMPVLWIGLSREYAAATGGALNLGLMYAGLTGYLLQSWAHFEETRLLVAALACAAGLGVSAGVWFFTRKIPFRDQRPLPRPLRWSFGVFAVTLILVGGALALKRPNIFPWPLEAEVSVVYGWIFLGAAVYFIYALRVPRWHNAAGQLLGFLAYDLVLILPFLGHFDAVDSDHRPSLIIYTLVVSLSGLLAAYYLFVHPETRFRLGRARPAALTA